MVVPDAFLNPAAGGHALLRLAEGRWGVVGLPRGGLPAHRPVSALDAVLGLAEAGWGVVALPRAGLPAHVREAALAAVVDQLTAFLDDGYEVALADPRDPMAAALDHLLGDSRRT